MKRTLASSAFVVVAASSFAQEFTEHFDNIGGATSNGQSQGANLEAQGWYFKNNSPGNGLTDWFQGNLDVFGPQSSTGYIAANYQNTDAVGTISNWMLTPTALLGNGMRLVFWTRTVTAPAFADRLQVRLSLNGTSTNVGTSPTDVGDFTTLMLDLNPTYTLTGYPTSWQQYTVLVSGLPAPTMGRFAFRYFVENGGPPGTNSDYIGIDAVTYPIPEPATIAALGLGVVAVVRRRVRGRQRLLGHK